MFIENPDGTISLGLTNERLSIDEFERLQALMPCVGWIGMLFPRPEDITNSSYVPSSNHKEFLKNYESDSTAFLKIKKKDKDN